MTKIDTQPEADKRNALQLAGALEDYMMAEPAIDPYTLTLAAAATELRRLHAENAAQAQQIAQVRADAARLDFMCNTSIRMIECDEGMWRVYEDVAPPQEPHHQWRAIVTHYQPTARGAIDAAIRFRADASMKEKTP